MSYSSFLSGKAILKSGCTQNDSKKGHKIYLIKLLTNIIIIIVVKVFGWIWNLILEILKNDTRTNKLLLNAGFRPMGDFWPCHHIHRICVRAVVDSKHNQSHPLGPDHQILLLAFTPPDSAGSPMKSPEVCRLVT